MDIYFIIFIILKKHFNSSSEFLRLYLFLSFGQIHKEDLYFSITLLLFLSCTLTLKYFVVCSIVELSGVSVRSFIISVPDENRKLFIHLH